jgi:hypothetical protein
MGLDQSPLIVTDGLTFYLDAANTRSYSGSGNTVLNIASSGAIGATKTAGIAFSSTSAPTFVATADSNYLLSDYTLASGTSFTVCMWFKRVGNSYWSALFGSEVWNSGTGYVAMLTSATTLSFGRGGAAELGYTFSGFASSNFNFYAFVKNPSGSNSFIYINGIGVTSGSISNVAISKPFLFNNRWVNAGTSPSTADSRQSQFAQMYVYNRALSASEIVQNYNATKRRYGL